MRRLIAALALLATAEAATAQGQLAPADARKIIVAERATIWRDPYSIRDARISAPHQCPAHALTSRAGRGAGIVCVCVRANAKNAMGGYTGLSTTRLLIEGRKIVDAQGPLGTAMPDGCGPFQAFPELGR